MVASSFTDTAPDAKRARIARLVGLAKAANVMSRRLDVACP
jgi:hypothetical protein